MKEKTLTYREAFIAMQTFLEKYYEETKSDDVGSLLGELSFDIWERGSTGDPACWSEWIQCIDVRGKTDHLAGLFLVC